MRQFILEYEVTITKKKLVTVDNSNDVHTVFDMYADKNSRG